MTTKKSMNEILAEIPLFRELDNKTLDLLSGCASNATFDVGDLIFREGEPADTFYVIRHGDVALDIFVPGQGARTIQTLHEKDVLGWSWLFEPYEWHYEARALTLIRTIAFDASCLRGKIEEDHDVGFELMKRFAKIMVERMQNTRLQLLDVYGHATN